MKRKVIYNIPKTNFSIIHNFHSPYRLYYNGKEYIYDDNIKRYNKYIQSFLTKRFTNKREISNKKTYLMHII